jgi:hypothetical protein
VEREREREKEKERERGDRELDLLNMKGRKRITVLSVIATAC